MKRSFLEVLENFIFMNNEDEMICFDNSCGDEPNTNQSEKFLNAKENQKYKCKYNQPADVTIIFSSWN